MRLAELEKKAKRVGKLIGRTLSIGSMRRQYRVEDQTNGEDACLGIAYLPAQTLWDRLDYAERALELAQQRR